MTNFATIKYKRNNRVICTFNGIPRNKNDVLEYLNEIDKQYINNIPFYLLYDARKIGTLDRKHIAQQASFMEARNALTRTLMCRCAIVVDSVAAELMLKLLFVLRPPVCKHLKIFKNMTEARLFLDES